MECGEQLSLKPAPFDVTAQRPPAVFMCFGESVRKRVSFSIPDWPTFQKSFVRKVVNVQFADSGAEIMEHCVPSFFFFFFF